MSQITRRELLQQAGAGLLATELMHQTAAPGFASLPPRSSEDEQSSDWFKTIRLLLAEGYNPPFYPRCTYDANKALEIAKRVEADSLRFPAMASYVYFPTKTKLPVHPELAGRDPLRETVDVFHKAGLKVVAYIPLNHPFMQVGSGNPDYPDWMKRTPEGSPMTTGLLGFGELYEGCLNSPVREQILAMVREIVTNYSIDLAYFDGPSLGLDQGHRFCHCKYCQTAYRKATGKPIPLQDGPIPLEDEISYRQWIDQDVLGGFMQEVRDLILSIRKLPMILNNSGLTRRVGGGSAWRAIDGFMFEQLKTPEQKLFNLQLGQSTGKVVWTYLSSYTQYNQEHVKYPRFCNWYSYPAEGPELRMDGATAGAANVGLVYWGLSRFYDVPDPLAYESGKALKEAFSFSKANQALFARVKPAPQAGILVGTQTAGWYRGKHFVPDAYPNYYHGAYQVLKKLSYDGQPFLDTDLTAESLGKFKLVYVPSAACLSDAQCLALTHYVEDGGTLIATHLTSVADEYGRIRKNFGLAEVLGVNFKSPEPAEAPDLYVRVLTSGLHLPQDPQVMLFEASASATVLAVTYDRGNLRTLGPAVVSHTYGKGKTIYIGSGLEAVYEETLMEPLRAYFASLLDPILADWRTYEVEARPGLLPHFRASENHLLLDLLANTGDKSKKSFVREHYLPVENVKVRLRLPQGRAVKVVNLLRAGEPVRWNLSNGWAELVVPRVLIAETVHVELS
jgi:hypothetical protein